MARLRTSVWMAAMVLLCSVGVGPAAAAPVHWVGGGDDGAWSDGDNWDTGAPPNPDDTLRFDGTDQTSTVNDLADGTRYDLIVFQAGAGSFTLAGNDLALVAGGVIRNLSSESQLISLGVEAEGDLIINAHEGDIQMAGSLSLAGGNTDLTLRGAEHTRIAGAISGGAGLVIEGDGTRTLAGANTYTGGTTLDGGHLRLEHHQGLGTGTLTIADDSSLGATAGLAGTVANDIQIDTGTTLTLDGFEQMILAGDISGDGDILKAGGAFIALTGQDNTDFTGTITIEQGAFGLASAVGGDVELIDGELHIFADEVIDEDQTLTLGGGTLVVADDFPLLESNVRLTNDVFVVGGEFRTLEFTGPFEVQGDHALDIVADTRLMIENLASDQAGRTLSKDGEGWLEISGDSRDFGGAIDVNAGTLNVQGELGSDVTVHNGAWLHGQGTIVGDVRINNAGQHGAGQTIEGSYTLATGGRLSISYTAGEGDVDADGLDVDGTATLQNNSIIELAGSGTLTVGDSIVAVSTTDGVADQGVVLDTDSAFLVWSGDVIGNDYVLTVEQGAVFQDIARGRNNIAVARALDIMAVSGLTSEQDRLLGELQGLGADAYNRALRHLAPEQLQAIPASALHVARHMHGTFTTRMAQQRLGIVAAPASGTPGNPGGPSAPSPGDLTLASAELSPAMLAQVIGTVQQAQPEIHPRLQTRDFAHDWHVDVQAFGLHQGQDTSGEQAGYRGRSGGFVLSADRSLTPAWRVGMSVGYAHTNLSFRDGRGEGYIDHFRAGPYASYAAGQWFIDAALSAGYHSSNLRRRVQAGQFDTVASSEADNFDIAAHIGGGYDFQVGRSFTVTPFAALDYLFYQQDSFTEGGGPEALAVDSAATQSASGTVGARLRYLVALADTTVIPELSLGYRHAFLNEHETTARFVGAPASFTITNDLESESTFVLGAGASALIGDSVSVYGHHQAEISSNDQNHLFSLGLQYRF